MDDINQTRTTSSLSRWERHSPVDAQLNVSQVIRGIYHYPRVCQLLLMLLLRRAPRVLEGSPRKHKHLVRMGYEDVEWVLRDFKGGTSLHLVHRCVLVFETPPYAINT